MTFMETNSKLSNDTYMKGWANYLDDETSSFENVRLTWERNSALPSWLDGSYVKNGPARRGFGDGRTYSSYMDSWGKLHKYCCFLNNPMESKSSAGSPSKMAR